MSDLVQLANELKVVEDKINNEYAPLLQRRDAIRAELAKLLNVSPPPAERKETRRNAKTMKEVIKGILEAHPNGLELREITAEVRKLIEKGEYFSNAGNLTSIVSQSVATMKTENKVAHDKESRKYSLQTATTAA